MRTREERALWDSVETGRGKRLAVLVAALVAVMLMIWALAAGFQGTHYRRNARALTGSSQPVR